METLKECCQDYLAKAQEAENLARLASDIVVRKNWARLALRYRKLATFATSTSTKGISWGQPSPFLQPPAQESR